jgi:glycosyltransferase involved in cell wall biosynthesis
MRVGLDANPILGDRGGVGWLTYHLLRALVALKAEDVEFIAYVKPGSLVGGKLPDWEHASNLRWVEAGRWTTPWRGRIDGLDLYHGTNFKMRTVGRYGGVVTIPDLWLDRHPEYSRKPFGQRASFYRTRRTAWRAGRVVTISEHSARDIRSLYALPADHIVVIPCGVSDDFRPVHDSRALDDLRQRIGLRAEKFILFVGGADPRKNHVTLGKAFADRMAQLQDCALVLIGDQAHQFSSYMNTVRSCGLEKYVVCPGRVSLENLRILYSSAALFVFPSIYEGFGMPVLEAMACGTPVITSNTTSLPEVAGDAAILINPLDDKELGEAMVQVLSDQKLAEDLRTKGFARVKQFTWERAARRTMEVYREVIGEGRG